MAALRILFYAVDGLGLGHVSRLLAIARQVRRQRADAHCLFLTASEAGEVIFREGFPAFKVPSRTARVTAALEPARYARMVQTVTWSLVSAFDPHLLVVDTFPAGTLQELLPLLRWNISKVFVFREQQPRYAADPYLQGILRLYQQVIVPHARGECNLPVPEGVPAHWVGPVLLRERDEALSREEARAQLGLPLGGPWVLVSFGGGGDAEGRRLATQCAALQGRFPAVGFALAPGPLWPESVPLPRLPLIRQYPLAPYLPAFDAAISAAGYNTAHELLHFGMPSVFLPVAKGVDDQQARARRIAEAGAGVVLDNPSDEALADGLARVLDPASGRRYAESARALVPPGGAAAAARAILALDERAQLP
jgi:UDP-N-acetylglucosamine--N-acetylmuramyl-(pentapeptide) pyrophosphoryl-undecaprenol N-acetylglucosamine transferase